MMTVGENKICGFEVTGKNTTNLKSHLQNRHKDVYKEAVENDAEKKSLQMRACLKLNRRVLASTDFNTTA